MADAVAKAAAVPPTAVRRAAMLSGDLGRAAAVALAEGEAGLGAIGLEVLPRRCSRCWPSTAADVAEALAALGPASVEWKLDGARIQVHRAGDEVRDLHPQPQRHHRPAARGGRRPCARCRSSAVVLDGEAIGVRRRRAGPRRSRTR